MFASRMLNPARDGMKKELIETVKLWDLGLLSTSLGQLLEVISARQLVTSAKQVQPLLIGTPNPEQVVATRKDRSFLHHLQQLDWLLPDGIGLVVASRLFAWRWGMRPIQSRIAGREVAEQLLQHSASDSSVSVLVIGGRNLGSLIDGSEPNQLPTVKQLKVIRTSIETGFSRPYWYWTEGYADITHPTLEEENDVSHVLQLLRPTIVFVAFGAPHQEAWLVNHRALLRQSHVAIGLAIGGAFDVLTGSLAPPPVWMHQLGLEWLFRLFQQPWRLKRQTALLTFIWMVLKGMIIPPHKV